LNAVRLEKRVPEKNQLRFYRLLLAPTLFGEWSLVREWGRIGHPGTVRINSYPTEAQAAAIFARKAREKKRRGYRDSRLWLDWPQ
jgi:predicted DNA-binding WGR domain protein